MVLWSETFFLGLGAKEIAITYCYSIKVDEVLRKRGVMRVFGSFFGSNGLALRNDSDCDGLKRLLRTTRYCEVSMQSVPLQYQLFASRSLNYVASALRRKSSSSPSEGRQSLPPYLFSASRENDRRCQFFSARVQQLNGDRQAFVQGPHHQRYRALLQHCSPLGSASSSPLGSPLNSGRRLVAHCCACDRH